MTLAAMRLCKTSKQVPAVINIELKPAEPYNPHTYAHNLLSANIMTNTTHFGYTTVEEDQKVHKVAEVFHSVAAKYDVMNDLMSAGLHRAWKIFTIFGSRKQNFNDF